MQKIPIMLAMPGMILARDVFRSNASTGIPICAKDSTLTDTLITRLEQMDVKTIFVKGHPVWQEGDVSLEDLLSGLDRRFEKVRNDPIAEKLRLAYVNYLKKSLGDEVGKQAE